MITFGLAVSICISKSLRNSKSYRHIKRYKWNENSDAKFKLHLTNQQNVQLINNLMQNDIEDVNGFMDILTKLLNDTANKSLKRKATKRKGHKKWFNQSCNKLKNEVKSLAKKLSSDPKNGNLRNTFFQTKKIYKKSIKNARITFKQNLAEKLQEASTSDPKSYWKLLDELKNIDAHEKVSNCPISSEEWVNHFKHLFKPHPLSNTVEEQDVFQELTNLEKQKMFNELSFKITHEEIEKAIRGLKPGKAAGPDNLISEIIKASATIILPPLQKAFNHILVRGTYPILWSEGIITALHKKGSLYDPDNYRGITVGNAIGKLFGMVLNNRLSAFCDSREIINERQSSHRKKCRTTDNVFIIKSLFEKYCQKNNMKLYTCFVDFRKAFDSIWHDALFLKLQRLGISGPFYDVIKNMYQKVTATVKGPNGELSNTFAIKRGVKQGDILSPLLFNLFINDVIPLFEENDSTPLKLIEQTVGCLLYADDLVILSSSPEGLQKSLNKLHSYCSKWKLEVNLKKSKVMCFTKSKKIPFKHFTYGECELDNVEIFTYLGIEISHSGSFKLAQKYMADKATRAAFKLRNLLHNSGLPPQTSLRLFDQLIKPICLYGSEIWGTEFIKPHDTTSKFFASMEKLACEKVNLSFSKFILGVHKKAQTSAIRGDLGRFPLGIDVVANIMKYEAHLESKHPNSLLGEALRTSKSIPVKQISNSWATRCSHIKTFIEKSAGEFIVDHTNRQCIKKFLERQYQNVWISNISQEPKMRSYILFKNTFILEDYLAIANEKHRIAMSKLRVSAHTLAIERGRYTRPVTPINERVCKTCTGNVIEDELHFLIDCERHATQRSQLFTKISNKCMQFSNLNNQDKFVYMLSSGTDTAKFVAAFIFENLT
jgi:hypothetical protein